MFLWVFRLGALQKNIVDHLRTARVARVVDPARTVNPTDLVYSLISILPAHVLCKYTI